MSDGKIRPVKLGREEQEVIIRLSTDSQYEVIYSAWPRWISKLDKLASENEGWVLVRRTETDVEYTALTLGSASKSH